MVESDEPSRNAPVVFGREDPGHLIVDLQVVAPRDVGELFTNPRPKIAERQAERIGLMDPSAMLEVVSVWSAELDKLAEGGTQGLQSRLQWLAEGGRRDLRRQELTAIQRGRDAVRFILNVTISEEEPSVFQETITARATASSPSVRSQLGPTPSALKLPPLTLTPICRPSQPRL